MIVKILKTSLWADELPHLPHRSLIKDVIYDDLSDAMAKSIIRQEFGVEVFNEEPEEESAEEPMEVSVEEPIEELVEAPVKNISKKTVKKTVKKVVKKPKDKE